jgi:hypothetical protein
MILSLLWQSRALSMCTGNSRFTPGLRSWKTSRKSNESSNLKQRISWELGDWQLHPVYVWLYQ